MELKIFHLECPWSFGIHKITFLVDEIWWKSLFLGGCILLFSGYVTVWTSSQSKKRKIIQNHETSYTPVLSTNQPHLHQMKHSFHFPMSEDLRSEAIRRSGGSGAPLRLRVTPGTILFYTIINSKSYPINCLSCLCRKRWNLDDHPLLDNGKTGCHVYHPPGKSPFLGWWYI